MAGESIDEAIKEGKLKTSEGGSVKGAATQKKKEGEAQSVSQISYTPTYGPRPQYNSTYQAPRFPYQPYIPPPQNTHTFYPALPRPRYRPNIYPNFPYAPQAQVNGVIARTTYHPRPNTPAPRNPPRFDPILMTYTELFPQLLAAKLITTMKAEPIRGSDFPHWYNPNVSCAYHQGQIGHSLEDCHGLKYRVQDLIRRGELNLQPQPEPNINQNPLPAHQAGNVNMVVSASSEVVKKFVSEVKTPMRAVFQVLKRGGFLGEISGRVRREACPYHPTHVDHDIQDCESFKQRVQELMDESQIKFYTESEELQVNVVQEEGSSVKKPLLQEEFRIA